MTDSAFYVSTADTSVITTLAANIETSLGLARIHTALVTAGDTTLSTNYDTVFVDATASVTISLVGSPTTGDNYRIIKYDSTASTLTVSRNGGKINGTAADISTITQYHGWFIEYSGNASLGWWAETLTGA